MPKMTFECRKETLNRNWKTIKDKRKERHKIQVFGETHRYICYACCYYFKHDLDKGSVFCPECNSIDVKEI